MSTRRSAFIVMGAIVACVSGCHSDTLETHAGAVGVQLCSHSNGPVAEGAEADVDGGDVQRCAAGSKCEYLAGIPGPQPTCDAAVIPGVDGGPNIAPNCGSGSVPGWTCVVVSGSANAGQ